MLHRAFLICLKYMPIIQMVGILVNNLLYFSDIYSAGYILDFVIGNSLSTSILLYLCSYAFKFCKWHRIIITSNLIIIAAITCDSVCKLPVTDIQLLIFIYLVTTIAIILATYSHIKDVKKQVK